MPHKLTYMRLGIGWTLCWTAFALAACGSDRASYLQERIGEANQQQVQNDLGRPDHWAAKDSGQIQWMYEDCVIPGTCSIWSLTFDRERILRGWDRAPEHL